MDISEKGFYIFLTDKGFNSFEAWQILNRFRCFKENKNDIYLKREYKKSISEAVIK